VGEAEALARVGFLHCGAARGTRPAWRLPSFARAKEGSKKTRFNPHSTAACAHALAFETAYFHRHHCASSTGTALRRSAWSPRLHAWTEFMSKVGGAAARATRCTGGVESRCTRRATQGLAYEWQPVVAVEVAGAECESASTDLGEMRLNVFSCLLLLHEQKKEVAKGGETPGLHRSATNAAAQAPQNPSHPRADQ